MKRTHSHERRVKQDVTGFIHNVSDILESPRKTKYFTADLQTKINSYDKLVCYSPEKMQAFKQLAEEERFVQVSNIEKTPSWRKDRTDDVLFGYSSKVRKLDGDSGYPSRKPADHGVGEASVMTVEEAIGAEASTSATLTVKLTSVFPTETVASGKQMTRMLIADRTGMINFTVFGESMAEFSVGDSLKIENLRVSEWEGRKEVVNKFTTKVFKIDDIGEVKYSEENVRDVNISEIKIKMATNCPHCGQPVRFEKAAKTVKCENCDRRHRVTSISNKLESTCKIDDDTNTDYKISHAVLNELFREFDIVNDDFDSMEEFLLTEGPFSCVLAMGSIVSLQKKKKLM